MVRAARRSEYFPVYYAEPLAGDESAPGFDLVSHPARREALERARDIGVAVATTRIRLLQEAGEQYAFLVFLPIYRRGAPKETPEERRQSLSGFALGVFRVGDMVETALKDFPQEGIDVHLSDASAAPGERICLPLQSLKPVLPIIRHHHERWDGSGYPDGLVGEAIPLTARILQVVDIFDALTTARPYKPALSQAAALQALRDEVARGWRDARVVEPFIELVERGDLPGLLLA